MLALRDAACPCKESWQVTTGAALFDTELTVSESHWRCDREGPCPAASLPTWAEAATRTSQWPTAAGTASAPSSPAAAARARSPRRGALQHAQAMQCLAYNQLAAS